MGWFVWIQTAAPAVGTVDIGTVCTILLGTTTAQGVAEEVHVLEQQQQKQW